MDSPSAVLVNLSGSSVYMDIRLFQLKDLPSDASILETRSKVYNISQKWNNPLKHQNFMSYLKPIGILVFKYLKTICNFCNILLHFL